MNLNGTEREKNYLPKDSIELGSDIDSDRIVEFEIDWLAKEEDIDFIFGGCHCTDAWYADGKIRGNISIQKAGYDRNTGSVSQSVFVYLEDGKAYFSKDAKKRRLTNPEKDWLRISLNGMVKL